MRRLAPSSLYRAVPALTQRMVKKALFTFAVTAIFTPSAYAAKWMDVATISSTLGNSAGRLCVGSGRTDLGCPAAAPFLDTAAGLLTIPGDLRVTGNLYISGTQSFDGVTFANGGISASSLTIGGVSVSAGIQDRIISNTTAVYANGASGIISLTTNGTTSGYFNNGELVARGVSTTGGISSTTGYFTDNVGIGTATPSKTLTVSGTTSLGNVLEVNHPTYPTFANTGIVRIRQSADTANGGLVIQRTTATASGRIFVDSNSNFAFSRGGTTNALIMTQSGSIAVGGNIADPSTSLDISGTLRMTDSGETCDSNRLGAIKYTSNEFYVCRNGSSWESFTSIATGAAAAVDRITSNSQAGVTANSTGYISLTTGGVTNTAYFTPASVLVNAGISSTGTVSATTGYIGDLAVGRSNVSVSNIGRMLLQQSTNNSASGLAIVSSAGSSGRAWMDGSANNFILSRATTTTLVLNGDATGALVGIGTLSSALPSTTLQVSGSAQISSWTTIGANTVPTSVLTLVGPSNTTGGITLQDTLGVIRLQMFPSNNSSVISNFANGGSWVISSNNLGVARFDGNSKSLLIGSTAAAASTTLQSAGSIRIGTESSATLAVCDTNRLGAIKYSNNAFYICQNTTNDWEPLATAGATSTVDRITSNSQAGVTANSTGYISLTTGGVTGTAYFTPASVLVNSGVSTTGPVSATSVYTPNITIGSSVNPSAAGIFNLRTGTIDFAVSNTGSYWNFTGGTGDSQGLSFNASDLTNQLVLATSGKIGIGTTAPASELDVSGTVRGNIFYSSPTSTGIPAWSSSNLSANVVIGGARNPAIAFTPAGSYVGTISNIAVFNNIQGFNISRAPDLSDTTTGLTSIMTISASTARVGIGTTTPGAKLDVNGTVSATGFLLNGLPLSTASTFASLTDVSYSLSGGNIFGPSSLTGAVAGITGTTAFGVQALKNASGSSHSNSAFGSFSLQANTTGRWNTAVGRSALLTNTTGGSNNAFGVSAMLLNTTGGNNVAVGNYALASNTTGNNNTAVGLNALSGVSTTNNNVGLGDATGGNINGANNTFVGNYAGQSYTAGDTSASNTLIGYNAGGGLTTGSSNLVIGANTSPYSNTGSNQLNLGNALYGDIGAGSALNAKLGINVTSPTTNFDVSGTSYFNGNVGIGTPTPSSTLHVAGTIRMADGGETCDTNRLGAMKYASSNFSICRNGSTWETLTAGSATGAATFASLTDISYSAINGNFGGNLSGPDGISTSNIISSSTAFGVNALHSASLSGSNNSAFGNRALLANTTGTNNTAVGKSALQSNTLGFNNTATGHTALQTNTTGSNNAAVGSQALFSNTSGSNNMAVGHQALFTNTTGNDNTAMGYQTLLLNSTGGNNTGLGFQVLVNNSTGSGNTGLGMFSLFFNTTGSNNTSIGYYSGGGNGAGGALNASTLLGAYSGNVLASGASGNILVGYNAGATITTGNSNTVIGNISNPFSNTGSNQLNITNAIWGNVGSGTSKTNLIGINVTSPTASLEVSGTISATALTINGVSITGTGTGAATFASLTDISYSAINGNFGGNLSGPDGISTSNIISSSTAFGVNALHSASLSGSNNSAFGNRALLANTTGTNNTAVGKSALQSNTLGFNNTATGHTALQTNTTGTNNTANGSFALSSNITGSFNNAFGNNALQSNLSNSNSAFGSSALQYNTTGNNNSALGINASVSNTTGTYNTSIGGASLRNNTTGGQNTTVGYAAGQGDPTSAAFWFNSILGAYAGQALTSGGSNTLIGYNAAGGLTIGSNNIVLGANTSPFSNTGNNQLNIGNAIWGNIGSGSNNANLIGINVTSATTALEVSGTISATAVNTTSVTTSIFTLQGVAGSAGISNSVNGADNLGNHTATTTLNMAGYAITSASTITATGTIKTTAALQSGNSDTTCSTAADMGKIRFDSTTNRIYLCRQ